MPVGYADGYPRSLSNRGSVLIHGRRCPIVGRVCMDQLMVAMPEGVPVHPGDEVVLIGTQGDESITVLEIATLVGTIRMKSSAILGTGTAYLYLGVFVAGACRILIKP